MERLLKIPHAAQQESPLSSRTTGKRQSQGGGKAQALQVVAGVEPWFEVQVESLTVFHGKRGGAGCQKASDGNTRGQGLERRGGGWIEPCDASQAILSGGLEKQGGLRKAAESDHSLAYFSALPVKVLHATPKEDEIGVRLQLLTRPPLAHLGGLVGGHFVLQRQHDQA